MLRQLLQASDVRAQLGLPRGRTISKVEGGGEWPDMIWQLDFADTAAQDTAMKARAERPEFETIRHDMRQLYQRFERPLYAPFSQDSSPPGIEPQQSILLFGVYCDASVNTAARAVVGRVQAVEFISGGTDVPRILDETGIAGLPQPMLTNLDRLPVRLPQSVCRMEDRG